MVMLPNSSGPCPCPAEEAAKDKTRNFFVILTKAWLLLVALGRIRGHFLAQRSFGLSSEQHQVLLDALKELARR